MPDRTISTKLKGKVLMMCVTMACLYSLETMELTARQQKMQVCENNWVRRAAGVKTEDRRLVEEVREDGLQKN